ncbi:MAG TPA: hypothetical protein VFS90_11550 [Pyrinomonadaceae bacterium]|nr:hypothetical protein [Pyrinomonadaceae bacterium]
MRQIYGPNQERVEEFLDQLSRIPWFTAVGMPTDHDGQLIRVRLEDVLALHPRPYQLWGNLLLAHEEPVDRLILDSARLGADNALQTSVQIRGDTVDDFFVRLAQDYPGYYKNTHSYAHELIALPTRLVLYAARETLIADLAPELSFFHDLMPWFARGHWPIGWQGNWPDGSLILW